jgi:putative transposase
MGTKTEFVEKANLEGANVAALCREYGLSRQTGHKWLRRFRERGYAGLEEGSRRPKATPLATAEDVVMAIVEARRAHSSWGPSKLTTVLARELGELAPSERTIARVLKRFGEVRARRPKRGRNVVERAPDVVAKASNDVWTIDFKGWWRTLDGSRVEPLTVRDAFSRYVLAVQLTKTTAEAVRCVMERLFRKHGVPKAIQCDNGTPFISTQSRGGLTTLSAWWVSLGIRLVRSRVASPQDNGGHERMHRDMAIDVESRPAAEPLSQQRACEKWRHDFNHLRPHDALDGRTPAEVYKPVYVAPRPIVALYPGDWSVRRVHKSGQINIGRQNVFLSMALRGQRVAFEPLAGLRFRGWFHGVDLGEIELPPTLSLLQSLRDAPDTPSPRRPQPRQQVTSLPPHPPRVPS